MESSSRTCTITHTWGNLIVTNPLNRGSKEELFAQKHFLEICHSVAVLLRIGWTIATAKRRKKEGKEVWVAKKCWVALKVRQQEPRNGSYLTNPIFPGHTQCELWLFCPYSIQSVASCAPGHKLNSKKNTTGKAHYSELDLCTVSAKRMISSTQ